MHGAPVGGGGGGGGVGVGLYRLGLALLDSVCVEGLKSGGQPLQAPPLQAAGQPVLQVSPVVQGLLPSMESLCQALHTHTSNALSYSASACQVHMTSFLFAALPNHAMPVPGSMHTQAVLKHMVLGAAGTVMEGGGDGETGDKVTGC